MFGNSGAGKTTLSKKLCADGKLAHLDLDTLAFKKEPPTERRDVKESLAEVKVFLENNESWVIDGGYSDILEQIQSYANEMIYLDLSAWSCQQNARHREWEPHKYETKEAQDKNLDMLLDWILDYYSRDGAFSKLMHNKLFDNYSGTKKRVTGNCAVT